MGAYVTYPTLESTAASNRVIPTMATHQMARTVNPNFSPQMSQSGGLPANISMYRNAGPSTQLMQFDQGRNPAMSNLNILSRLQQGSTAANASSRVSPAQ